MNREKIIVIDFGGQYNQLVARRAKDFYKNAKKAKLTNSQFYFDARHPYANAKKKLPCLKRLPELTNDMVCILKDMQPDIMIVCDKDKLDGNRCNGAPDFIIEIVSPGNPADDYIRKLYYYQHHGVREYWIVDPRRKCVTVYFFEGNIFSVPYTFESTIKVNIYDDLYINFSEITNGLNM